MEIAKIVCYGDSNTYGWDPRFFSGDRYDHPWPEQVARMTGYKVINCGEPGRIVPCRKEHLEWFRRDVQMHNPDLLMIMLGTNDLLNMSVPDADKVAENMGTMIRYAKQNSLSREILLLSCPGAFIEGGFYMPALRNLSDRYREIAEQEKIFFADPFRWDISMAYDGIHFSEEGHRIFAERMKYEFYIRVSDGAITDRSAEFDD